MKRLVFGLACACAGLAGAANTWWVDDDAAAGGNGSEASPFQTIQAAINAAGANDTIMVKPGTYDSGETKDAMSDGNNFSRVLITKPLRIESTDGAAVTHIVGASDTTSETAAIAKQNGLGDNSVRCVTADDNAIGSTLKGFTIRGGRSRYAGNANTFAAHAGGIASHKESALTVVDCVISNNVATRGGACYRVNLVRSLLTHNRATNNGGSATRVCYHYACVLAHNGDNTDSTSKSAISDPRSVIHCSLFGNGNGGLYMEGDYAAKVYNSIVILEGNNNGTPSSLNIGSGTTKAPTLSKCVYSRLNNTATKVTVDTSYLINGSVTPWQTMVSPYSGDYRVVKGGLCDGTGNPTVVEPSWVPAEFRGKDFYGKAFLTTDGKVNIGAVAMSAKAAGGVHFLNGSVTWSVDGYTKSPEYGELMYMRGTPADSITLREVGAENRIFNFDQRYHKDWGWLRVFDNDRKLVLTLPPEGTVVTNWSNAAKGVVYADPKGSDANDGTAGHPVKTLKKAVELADDNYIIRCAEGTYDEGTTDVGGVPTRLYLNKQVVVRGAGAGKSIIKGNCDTSVPEDNGCGPAAVRCVYAVNNSTGAKTTAVVGFTLQDGCTKGGSASATATYQGGAFYAPAFGCRAQVVDCYVTNCAASRGVMYGGWAHRTVFDHNKLCKASSESFRNLVMSACVVKDNNPTKGGYYTVGNGGLVIVNTTFAGNGNPPSASTIFGQIHGSTHIALNCVVDGDQQGPCTGVCADGNWQSYRSGQAGWNHVTVMNLADLANRDLRPRADSPVIGGGSFGNDAVITGLDQCNNLTAAQWYSMVTSTDVDGNPYLYVNGQPTAGAYQRPVAVVTVEAAASGEVEPTGAQVLEDGESITITAKGAANRQFLGFSVNGELMAQDEKTFTYTVPSALHDGPIVLKAAYNTDWYVNPTTGNDANTGWTPETAKKTLIAAMVGPVSGDTVHAAAGVYNEGTVADAVNSTTKCRVNVPSGVTLLGDDRDATIIEGKAPTSPDQYGLGADAVRGVYLNDYAKVKNLTIRNGATKNGANAAESWGGGVLGTSWRRTTVEDCTIHDCRGSRSGAGHQVLFNRCRLINNYGASTGAAGRACSYHNTYIAGCGGNSRPMQETGEFINSTYDLDQIGTASRNLFEGAHMVIANSVFLQPGVDLKSYVTSMKNSIFVTGSGISQQDTTKVNVTVKTPEEIALDPETRVPTKGSCLVDAGDASYVATVGDTDCNGIQRVYNDSKIDIGAFEYDWRAAYAKDLQSSRVTVTAADPQIVEENGTVKIPSGELTATWRGGTGKRTVTAQVTGTGTLEMFEGEADEPTCVWTASADPVAYKWRPEGDIALRFVYTPDAADDGAAYLVSCEDPRGMAILMR